jgi:hypothetical protein
MGFLALGAALRSRAEKKLTLWSFAKHSHQVESMSSPPPKRSTWTDRTPNNLDLQQIAKKRFSGVLQAYRTNSTRDHGITSVGAEYFDAEKLSKK